MKRENFYKEKSLEEDFVDFQQKIKQVSEIYNEYNDGNISIEDAHEQLRENITELTKKTLHQTYVLHDAAVQDRELAVLQNDLDYYRRMMYVWVTSIKHETDKVNNFFIGLEDCLAAAPSTVIEKFEELEECYRKIKKYNKKIKEKTEKIRVKVDKYLN